MTFKMSTKVTGTEVTDSGVKLTMEPSAGGAEEAMDADVVLVSTGRRPLTRDIGLEEMGIPMDKFGRITVDHTFRTNVPSVWAIGDCIDGPMLAHKVRPKRDGAGCGSAGGCG